MKRLNMSNEFKQCFSIYAVRFTTRITVVSIANDTRSKRLFKVFRPARKYILRVRTCISSNLPLETGRKLNERKTSKKLSGRLLNVLYVMRPGN